MLEIIFLGTGSGIPTPQRNHTSIWLRYEGEYMLWDCGEGTQRQIFRAKANLSRIDRIFITHWHADHWAGLIPIMQTMNLEGRRRPLYIYAPEAERFVGDILDMDYWEPRFKVIPKDVPHEGNEITKLVETKDFEIFSIPTKHSVPSAAYCFLEKDRINVDIKKAEKLFGLRQGPLVGKLKEKGEVELKGKKIRLEDVAMVKKGVKVVYSGDTMSCQNMVEISRGADVLMHDSTFAEEMEDRMHTGVKGAAETAKKAGVKKLYLIHFSRRYTDLGELRKEARKVFPNTELSEDLMRIEV